MPLEVVVKIKKNLGRNPLVQLVAVVTQTQLLVADVALPVKISHHRGLWASLQMLVGVDSLSVWLWAIHVSFLWMSCER